MAPLWNVRSVPGDFSFFQLPKGWGWERELELINRNFSLYFKTTTAKSVAMSALV
jgi:hypothetical protein